MRVTLIRHAEAGDDAPRDEARALTLRGRSDSRRLGRTLARHGVSFHLLMSSPLVRAVQTAEIVAAEIDYGARVLVTELLVPEGAASGVLAFLRSAGRNAPETQSIALCAHEPILSALAAALTQRSRHPALQKAEALRIRLPDGIEGRGTLRWRIDAQGRRERL
jgi:phosphohistidine phosphatase